MRKLFEIKPSVDTNETGSGYPAVLSYDDYDFNSNNSLYKLPFHERISREYDLRFRFNPHCKPTSLLSNAAFKTPGLLIDLEFCELLKSFCTTNFELLDVKIEGIRKGLSYKWFHFAWENWGESVNWNLSQFEILDNGGFLPISVNSMSEYEMEKSKSQYFRIRCSTAVLLDIELDLYSHPFIGNTIVSEKLKEVIVDHRLTGIEFVPYLDPCANRIGEPT